MSDVFDYLEWRGDIEVDKVPLCEADYVAICCMSYFPFDGIIPKGRYARTISLEYALREVYEQCESGKKDKKWFLKEDKPFAEKLMESPRFLKLDVTGFVNIIDYKKEEQFAAFTIVLPDKSPVVVFRGTDANIVAWKEDFNMAYTMTVPAQVDAVKYLNIAAEQFDGPIKIVGHSKGGNLAIYAAANCDAKAKKRISGVWNMDGPGFIQDQLDQDEFVSVMSRVHTFVPQLSVVGMMFDHDDNYQVVESNGKLFWQHCPYTWQIRRGCLETKPELKKLSRRFNRVVKQWLDNLDMDKREKIVESLFEIMEIAEINQVEDFLQLKKKYNLFLAFGKLDSDKRKILMESVKVFSEAMWTVYKNSRMKKKLLKIAEIEELSVTENVDEQELINMLEELEDDNDEDTTVISEKYEDFSITQNWK